jgi:hypothetical protein
LRFKNCWVKVGDVEVGDVEVGDVVIGEVVVGDVLIVQKTLSGQFYRHFVPAKLQQKNQKIMIVATAASEPDLLV